MSQKTNYNKDAPPFVPRGMKAALAAPKKKNNKKKNSNQPKKPKPKVQEKKKQYKGIIPEAKYGLIRGEGARGNIMVIADVVPSAIQDAPLALISLGYTRQWFEITQGKSMYWAYLALARDLIAIFDKQVSPIVGRPSYLNAILATYLSKQIPFKTGQLTYSWSNVNSVNTPSLSVTRSYNYYMYELGSSKNAAQWLIQVAPTSPSPTDNISSVLSTLLTIIEDEESPGTKIEGGIFHAEYQNDVSGYAATSGYYGAGNSTAGAACASAELEVPFKSNILANYCRFVNNNGRTARNYKITSGDSTVSYGLGYLRNFKTEFYKTAYPIIFKFIDIDEVVLVLCHFFAKLASSFFSVSPESTAGQQFSQVSRACTPFPYTAQQFRLAVRQNLLTMFADTQALVQHITYSTAPNGFEPLRVGSNCYGPVMSTTMAIPTMLNENLKCLQAQIYDIYTKFHSSKNKQIVLPVWGAYTSAVAPNPIVQLVDEEGQNYFGPLFTTPAINADPRIIDGVDSDDNPCDLNASKWLKEITSVWNEKINSLATYSAGVTNLGGTGRGLLLTMTRMVEYKDKPEQLMSDIPFVFRGQIPRDQVVTKKVGKDKIDYYIPNNGSLATQYVKSITSLATISETSKQVFNYFILPSTVIEPTGSPTIKEVRTAILECNITDFPQDDTVLSARQFEIINLAGAYVTGLAGRDNNEAAAVVNAMNTHNEGGFVGDMVGALASLLPF